MVPSLFLSMFAELTQIIEEKARKYEYEIMIINTNDDPNVEEENLKKIRDSYTDGLLIVATGQNKRLIREINSYSMPVVQIVRNQNKSLTSVDVNYFECGYNGVKFLHNNGCKNISILNGIMDLSPFSERYRGYLKAISELNLDDLSLDNNSYEMNYFKNGYNKFIKLISGNKDVDGILTANDLQAMGVLRAAKDSGFKIPEDLKILSLSGHSIGDLLETKISSMEMPLELIADKSIELIVNKINSENEFLKVEHITYNATLNPRETTN